MTPALTTNTTYYVQDSTCAVSATRRAVAVTVNPLPLVTTNLSGITITANQSGAAYQWLNCNTGNSVIMGAINQSFTPTLNGDYAVIVTLNGCSDTSACLNVNKVGMENTVNGINRLIVYPNPNNGVFTIQSTSEGVYSIINDLGQTIKVFELNSSNKYTSNIENISNGIYYITGYSHNQKTSQKVVVMK